jgi:5-methylcytosine-specific restriction enzyme subunit McrC
MFDMNRLWEAYVYQVIRKAVKENEKVSAQQSKDFWESTHVSNKIRPDMLLEFGEHRIILDTKWKMPENSKPADSDLHQMFAYNIRFKAKRSYLLYPSQDMKNILIEGEFLDSSDHYCGLAFLPITEEGKLSTRFIDEFVTNLRLMSSPDTYALANLSPASGQRDLPIYHSCNYLSSTT